MEAVDYDLGREMCMKKFPERLSQLRKSKKLTQAQMSARLDINHNTYASYERGIRDANIYVLAKVSQVFDVSADYLLGLSDVPKAQTDKELAAENQYLRERLQEIQRIITETRGI